MSVLRFEISVCILNNSEGLGKMFEGDSSDMCVGKFPLVSMGGRVEGLACADPGARTPIGLSGNFKGFIFQ